jgi:hypothetical protein
MRKRHDQYICFTNLKNHFLTFKTKSLNYEKTLCCHYAMSDFNGF